MRNAHKKYSPMLLHVETGEVLSPGEVSKIENCPFNIHMDARTPEEVAADKLKRAKFNRMLSPTAMHSDFTAFIIALLPGEPGMPVQGRFLPDIELKHIMRLAVLSTYIPYNNRVQKTPIYNSDGNAPMTRAEMQEILQLKTREFKYFLSAAQEADYLSEKDGIYYLSKDLHKGKIKRKKLQNINLFNANMIRKLHDEAVLSGQKFVLRSIGSILALLPYIHKQQNVLCMNPYGSPADPIQYMTDADICRVLGYGEHNAERTMDSIMRDIQACSIKVQGRKQFLLIRTEEAGQIKYIVNPNIIYSGKNAQALRTRYNFDAF